MSDGFAGAVLAAFIIVPMVALAWTTLQPTRRSVWTAAACLSLLPVAIIVLVLVVWVMGQ